MSSILTGAGGRTYGFDFDFVKSPSPSTSIIRPSHTSSSSSSSPSSTISESSNSPLAISTRKPRTPRKRPNQTYNEAAALLSTAYPNLFSNKNLKNAGKFTRRVSDNFFIDEELFLPFTVFDGSSSNSSSSFLLQQQPPIQQNPSFQMEPKMVNLMQEKPCQSPGEIISRVKTLELDDDCGGGGGEDFEDFDAESILDEEIDEGIDSIMGGKVEEDAIGAGARGNYYDYWSHGFGFGGKIDFRLGLVRALRRVDEGNWWNFPAVDIVQISPRINDKRAATTSFTSAAEKVKKEKKKENKKTTTTMTPATATATAATTKKKVKKKVDLNLKSLELPKSNGLMLKLNYDDILSAWSERGSPFAGGTPEKDAAAVGSPSPAGRSKPKSKIKKKSLKLC